ncbi:MAG TPA: TPM domain-containing protein [Syntrophales bacterium]|nr:TPM domain-containing protein [Syntrophales bacterium]
MEGLRTEIASLEQKKGSQIAVLMLRSVKTETIEQFALRTFDAWKLGRKGVDDGALIITAKDDRQMRIEVGYGLEGVLTDPLAGRIIDEQIRPLFRKSDYGGALTAAVQQIIKVIEGGSLPPVKTEVYENQFPDKWVIITAGVIILFCIVLRFWLPAWLCSLISGLGAGGLVWMNTMPAMALFAALFSAALTFILPGAVLGGGGGSPSRGFGGSSDGDSGGGGSSGGGGASGSW